MVIVRRKPIQVDNISLEELHQLRHHFETTQELPIDEIKNFNPATLWMVIIVGIGSVLLWNFKIKKIPVEITHPSSRDETTEQT